MRDSANILVFDQYELDFGRGEIRHRGKLREIQPTPLRVLLYLAEQRDRIVSRAELLDAIWPEAVVGDEALTTALAEARRAVGDNGTAQRVIRTHKARGYRFVAEASVIAGVSVTARRAREARSPVIGVFPFRNLGESSLDTFIEGLNEQVNNQVARRSDAIALTSVRDGGSEGARDAARAHGATHVLTGTVSHYDGRLRITAAIVSVRSGLRLNSTSSDFSATEPLAAQSRFARDVAGLAYLSMPWEVCDDAARSEAIELTKVGQISSWLGSPERGIKLLERALALDRTIPRTHLYLTYVWSNALDLGKRSQSEALARMDAHATEVERLAPGSADSHSARLVPHVYRREWTDAEWHARAALALGVSPVHDGTNLAAIALATGQTEIALPILRGQIELEPDDPSRTVCLGSALLMERRFAEAENALVRFSAVSPLFPRDTPLLVARWFGGQRDRVAADLLQSEIPRGDEARAAENAQMLAHDRSEAVVGWYARSDGSPDLMEAPFATSQRRAVLHAIAGDEPAALSALETLPPWYRAPEMLFWPVFDALRSDPRFLAVVERFRVTEYHARYLERARNGTNRALGA